jgi:hypothetical protein
MLEKPKYVTYLYIEFEEIWEEDNDFNYQNKNKTS